MDQQTFAEHVEDALAHIFDHFYLQFHPLSGLLAAGAPAATRGRALSRLLVEAIERLKPGPDVPPNSLAWRKYHYMYYRYVQALSPDQISKQLGVSDRQGRRDHRQALDALCTLLWDDYQLRADATSTPPRAETPVAAGPDVDDELLRIGRVAPRAACELGEIVAGAIQTTEPLLTRQRQQVRIDVPSTLPPVAINPLILREVVIGLITQAVDLSQGSEIRIVGRESGPSNTLTVSCRTATAVDQLGLFATGRRLIEMQGGSLHLIYETNQQLLCVRLELPVVERATVLVIDDNPDVVLLFRRYLGQSYRLVQASSPDEAVALAEELRPALITLDVMMPGRDGWQVLEQLRRDPKTATIPVVVCSILPEPSLALALGAVAYLPKPINPLALRSTLDRHLERLPSARPGSP